MNSPQKQTRNLNSWYHNLFNSKNDDNSLPLTIALTILVLAVGGYYTFNWYSKNKDQAAHTLFSQNLEELERVMQDGKADDWASVQTLFKLGYDQYPKSSLAPYFLIYQAEAMLKQGNMQQAVEAMEKAVSQLPKNSPVRGLYQTKVALMQLDSSDQQAHKTALKTLQHIASDSGNSAQDVAAYQLGLYYWVNDDIDLAKKIWTDLIEAVKTTEKSGKSPWAEKAEAALASVGA